MGPANLNGSPRPGRHLSRPAQQKRTRKAGLVEVMVVTEGLEDALSIAARYRVTLVEGLLGVIALLSLLFCGAVAITGGLEVAGLLVRVLR